MVPITRLRLWRSARVLAIAVLVVIALYQDPVQLGSPVQAEWRPMTPVSYVFPGDLTDPTVGGELLAFNDFHGRIDPESGSAGQVNGTPAGGSEYLGTALKALREDAIRRLKDPPSVVTVSSGDNCGAEQFVSAQFKCEPTIEIFNKLGVQISAVGNHDLDRGKDELLRLQRGGCVPGGCGDPDGFRGGTFQYLAANTRVAATGSLILPPFTIRLFRGVPVAFLGMTLKGTAAVANPNGVKGLVFDDMGTPTSSTEFGRARSVRSDTRGSQVAPSIGRVELRHLRRSCFGAFASSSACRV
jgi:5'-nucleotidase